MPRITIHDVAKKAGCSITAVSLVLNGKKSSISSQTKQRVLLAAKELNYRPNQLAVGMVTKRTNVVGIILPDSSNLYFASLLRIIDTIINHAGYSLILANTANDSVRAINALQMFMDRQVDGIIYVESSKPKTSEEAKSMDFALNSPIPLVIMCRSIPNDNIHAVSADHVKGGYMSTSYLLGLGHRRIACMTGPLHISSCIERIEGYKSALNEAGIEYDDQLIFEGDFHLGNEQKAMDKFLSAGATAVFTFNDTMALGLYRDIRRRNLRIPQDISILGYDDLPFSDLIEPAVTTVRQPVDEIATCTAHLLLNLMDGKSPPQKQYFFEPTLLVRESTMSLC